MSLEQAIHKLTFMVASVYGLEGRGLLRPGYTADLTGELPGQVLRGDAYKPSAAPAAWPIGKKYPARPFNRVCR